MAEPMYGGDAAKRIRDLEAKCEWACRQIERLLADVAALRANKAAYSHHPIACTCSTCVMGARVWNTDGRMAG